MSCIPSQMTREETSTLDQDPLFCKAISTAEQLREAIRDWEPKRDEVLERLRDIKRKIAENYHRRTLAKVSGASAAAVGSSIAIAGFGLSFLTCRTSLGLSMVGGALVAAGGTTMAGSDVWDWAISRSEMKAAEDIIEQDRKRSRRLQEGIDRLLETCKALNKEYPSLSKGQILTNVIKGECKIP